VGVITSLQNISECTITSLIVFSMNKYVGKLDYLFCTDGYCNEIQRLIFEWVMHCDGH